MSVSCTITGAALDIKGTVPASNVADTVTAVNILVNGNGDYSNVTGLGSYPAWYTYRGKITSAVIAITNIRSARKMFAGYIPY